MMNIFEAVFNMQEQMGNGSREMETKRKKQYTASGGRVLKQK